MGRESLRRKKNSNNIHIAERQRQHREDDHQEHYNPPNKKREPISSDIATPTTTASQWFVDETNGSCTIHHAPYTPLKCGETELCGLSRRALHTMRVCFRGVLHFISHFKTKASRESTQFDNTYSSQYVLITHQDEKKISLLIS